jgi:membrane protease YdiL (CAAX protease family)
MASPPDTQPVAPTARGWLAVECLLLFGVAPLALWPLRHTLAFRVVPLVMIIGLLAGLLLIRDRRFDRAVLWSPRGLAAAIRQIVIFFALPAAGLTLVTWWFLDAHFLAFPRRQPIMWGLVLMLYPLLAALPQEIVFRCFFFHRYRYLLPHPVLMVLASAASFGLAHLFYASWVAPLLSFMGGLLFGWRYLKTRSLLAVSIEHALWGNFLFTVGLGWFFYSGAIQ